MNALVTTTWLAGELGASDLRIVDGTWHMPQLKRDARGEFAEAHIPGAVFFDIDRIAFGLYVIGREDVAVYDGSWTEWGGRVDTPVKGP
jgi:3-mercaptopyruvate sulfurtransferase SseA